MNTVLCAPVYGSRQSISSLSTASTRSIAVPTPDNARPGNLPVLIQCALESLMDGIMLLSAHGDLLFANSRAQRICHQFAKTLTENSPRQHGSRPSSVPLQIWRSCQALLDEENAFPPEIIIIEDEIKTETAMSIRIRVQWLQLNAIEHPCLLVTLEDRQQSAQHKAISEAQKYGLSDRETQVWLLKQSGATYKTIAAKLHISEDTVRKHIKNIHTKRDKVERSGVF